MSGAVGRQICLLFLASWGELKKMASRLYTKYAYSQLSVNSDTRLHPPLEFPSRSLLSQTTLRCRLLRLRIILLSALLMFVTKSFGFLSLTTELETLRARSPFGLDSALQKIRLAPRVLPVRKFASF